MRRFAAGWVALAVVTANAQPTTDATEIELFDFEADISEVAAAAKFVQRAEEAPAVVSAFGRDQLRSLGWYSLNDILYHLPGFAPARDYERRTVGARGGFEGWNNNHLLLLVDGVPFNDNLYGSAYTWEITPLFFARSVEIIRGPGSALYGTNATNGVLAINTLSAELGKPVMEARVRIGTQLSRSYDAMALSAGRYFRAAVGLNHHETLGEEYLGYDGSGRTDAGGALSLFPIRDTRQSTYLFAKLEGAAALEGLSLQIHNQAWAFETGHGWLWYAPDHDESMQESRQLIALAYRSPGDGALHQEYVLRFQRHNLDWDMRFYPGGTLDAYGSTWPYGLTEALLTHADDLFGRAQWSYRFAGQNNVLLGLEATRFMYGGDDRHHSNVDFLDPATAPAGGFVPLDPWFEYIAGRPVHNVAAYAQLATERLWHRRLAVTAGLRYDNQFFTYVTDPYTDGAPEGTKSFSLLSPRVALVGFPAERLTLKLLAGRAFRAPAPSELFGANTYSLASNIEQLRPEILTSYEAAADWRATEALTVRGNVFVKDMRNQIAYSVANANLSTNVYSQRTAGVELELSVNLPPQSWGQLGGFMNYSYARLVSETIQDSTIAPSPDQLTWAPEHLANVSVLYSHRKLVAALAMHLQGPVARRSSDRLSATFAAARPLVVPAWATLDLRVAYQLTPYARLGVEATNLTGSTGPLIKNFDYPFDYRLDGRRVSAVLELSTN